MSHEQIWDILGAKFQMDFVFRVAQHNKLDVHATPAASMADLEDWSILEITFSDLQQKNWFDVMQR